MDPAFCWDPATSPHPHHMQCYLLQDNGGKIFLHAVSIPAPTPPQYLRMPPPLLEEETFGYGVGGRTLSNAKRRRIPQSD